MSTRAVIAVACSLVFASLLEVEAQVSIGQRVRIWKAAAGGRPVTGRVIALGPTT